MCMMLAVNLQLGAKVRRIHDIGMDMPGSVMRLKDAEALVYWPQDDFYQVVPTEKLEPYGSFYPV